MRILGVDCGSRITGFGLIETQGTDYRFVDCGAIRPPSAASLADCLRAIHDELSRVIRDVTPGVAVFESVFHAANARSALKLGHVRGVAIFAAADAGIPVFEYSALQVKSAVSGYGRAGKPQVQEMVRVLLGLSVRPQPYDASDALAVAICHAHSRRYVEATQIR